MSRNRLKLLLLVLTVAYLLPFTQVLSRVGDEGIIVYGAQRICEGAIPGRDFVEVIGPGAFYWLALFFKLFGTAWQVTRLYLLFTGVTTVMLLYDIARQLCREAIAVLLWLFVLIVGMPLWPAVSHHWDSNFFAVLALWCFLKFENTNREAWAVAAGSMACITSSFMPEKGFFLMLAFAATMLGRRFFRQASILVLSYTFVGVVVLAAFWRAGALHDLFIANVVWPLTSYHGVNASPYGYLLLAVAAVPALEAIGSNWLGYSASTLSLVPFLTIAILPLLFLGSLATHLVSREKLRTLLITPPPVIVLAGLALWLSEIHRRDIFHLVYGSPLLLIALFASRLNSAEPVLRRTATGILAVALLAFGCVNLIAHQHGSSSIETRRGTVRSVMDNDALQFLSTAVKPRESVFVYPYYSMYYYLADVVNPTRFSSVMYNYNTPEQFDEVIRSLQQKRVPYVLWDTEVYGEKLAAWFPSYHQPDPGNLKLERYLQQNYDIIAVKSGFRILKRHLFAS